MNRKECGRGRGLILIVSSHYLPGWAKENHEKPHSGNNIRDSNQTSQEYKLEALAYTNLPRVFPVVLEINCYGIKIFKKMVMLLFSTA